MTKSREHFGSRFAVVMAMSGSAIGLGNIWRFPYLVGENGGAAFIAVYILASLFLSVPIFLAESIIGRRTHSNTFGAIDKLAPGSCWKWLGLITVFTPLIILSYYSVVGGWSIEYLIKSLEFKFTAPDVQFDGIFGTFISSAWWPLACHTIFLFVCALIIVGGVKGGIEKFSNFSMPVLFLMILIIMIYSFTLPGAKAGVIYLVKPDFAGLTRTGIASAMGQSFYSLSLGVGTILTYSSYVSKKENLLTSGLGTAGFDLLFALMAGFAVMSAVFAAGIAPGSGPGLIFETLPYVFNKMATFSPILSSVVAILFFLTVLIAALTSAVSLFEVGVAYLVEEKNVRRMPATVIIFFGVWLVGCMCSLSFGPLKGFTLYDKNLFSFLDMISSNFLMAAGAMVFAIFVGWKMKREDVYDEFTNGGTLRFNVKCFPLIYFLIKYVAPVVIGVIFISGLIM